MDVVVAHTPQPPIASAAHARRLAGLLTARIEAHQAEPRGAFARAAAEVAPLTPREEEVMAVTRRVQIVGRIPAELSRRVRAEAKQRNVSLNSFLIDASTSAVGGARRTVT